MVIERIVSVSPTISAAMLTLENLQPLHDEGNAKYESVKRPFSENRTIGAIEILNLGPDAGGAVLLKWRADPQDNSALLAVGENGVDLLRRNVDA